METTGQRDRQKLLTEAERIRGQVHLLKQQRRNDPRNPALTEEYERLKARYRRIEQMLAEAPTTPAAQAPATPQYPPPPLIDPELLEPRKALPPAVPKRTGFSWDFLTAPAGIFGALSLGVRVLRIAITSVLLVVILAFAYLYAVQDMRFFIVPTRSMQPTLYPMDRIVTIKADGYLRGDIVVFPDPDHPGDYLAKRIVGLPGDSVAVRNRVLIVNERPVHEPYITEPMDFSFRPVIVPPGEVFVLGDNRNRSEDSKDWGQGVPLSGIRGRVTLIYMPFERFQRVPRDLAAFAAL